ncbi:Laminin subunit alpha-3 [Heterocephalus glaber]|uniref:Laminin subunit alpha-3 n=1 Tax=Heterocephalus glaber TaxID=10181 RepID=G5BLQ8_HETGA|nr:Laminin subunit alpha-3 [Heterocephalus glaber]
MKYEIEDGIVPNGKILRFGFDYQEFPRFSWRGYAQMTALQDEVKVTLDVGKADHSLFQIILRYVNPGTDAVSGHITIYPNLTKEGVTQSKEITFLPSKQPAFVTIPGNGPAEPFSMTPGTWVAFIKAKGILLDYLVLLPRDYYEASALRPLVTEPCGCQGIPQKKFSCFLAEKASTLLPSNIQKPLTLRKPSRAHPLMVDLSGQEVELHLLLRVPQAGHYAILLEYTTETKNMFVLDVTLRSWTDLAGRVNIYSCKYSTLCRSAVIDGHRRIAVYELSRDTNIQLTLHEARFLLYQVTLRGVTPQQGPYVFIAHFYQAAHPPFPVHVSVDGGKRWIGSFQAAFCPHVLGCQEEVITQGQVEFDNPNSEVAVTVKVPKDKSLVLVRVLVVSAENYNHQIILQKTFLDKSPEFITNCGKNSFYLNPETVSRFCKNSARSLVAFYHNGSLPCDCHPAGSISSHCIAEGGQCPCQPNVIGRRCTRCASGYYGFPDCKPCNCGQHLCDETTGQCLCPPNTVQPQCEACEVDFYSFHPMAGCESCDCSQNGTHSSMKCDPVTGQCSCSHGGTEPQVCDKETKACFCKENVEGEQCDRCHEGSFHFDPANPKGCSDCFCFGVTHLCTETKGLHVKFRDMNGWHLETADGVNISVAYNPSSQSVVADLQELPSTVHNVSWVAPPSFLGDKVTSYSGYLTYQIKSFGLPEDMVLLEKAPDVQLTGQHLSIVHENPNNPQPDQHHKVELQLIEGNFRHVGSGAPVSREELMVLLSGLERLSIRGLYFTETQRLTLSWVGLDVLSHEGSEPAPLVEKCTCPPGYMGDSCQNCQHSTAGGHCERCKDGHYRNAAHGPCRACPCPHTNSFATGCVVNGGNVQCACKLGYTGVQCERCAPGYFGNPQKFGGSCQPCNCNGNGQLGSCHPVTGDCDSCVMTLLNDLATIGEELHLVKSQLQGLSTSLGALEQIQHMETQAKDLRNQLLHYHSAISNHRSKMNGLEKELNNLNHEFETLEEKAQVNSRKAQTLYNNVDRTIQSTKELDMKIKNVIQNVHILLKQISGTGGGGDNLPSGGFSRELAEAERKLREMRNRHLGKHLQEAEAEEREAQLCKALYPLGNHWLETQQVGDNGLAKNIQESLNDYEAKLHDLRAMIQEAAAQAKQAAGLNHENERALGAIKRQVNEISSLHSEFTKYLSIADSTLIQTNSMLQLMDKNWKEYENLAATLNEARQELSDKVRELSRSSSQESLVVQAEKHAQSLQELAKQLEEMQPQAGKVLDDLTISTPFLSSRIKQNASGDELVRRAVDAATAYENILNAIQVAEDAANKATSASESTLQTVIKEDLPRKAKTLSSDSDKLLNEAKRTQKKLQQEISPALNNLQQALNIMKVQKELIDTNLTSIHRDLRGIQRGDIDSTISGAKSVVKKASDITSEVLDGLSPIQTDLERIKDNYESAQSEDFNKALTDADKSVKKLTKKLPGLLSKIESINQQLLPLGNISDNVDRIRELIQQARDAANKVAVPMRFNGKSGVEVRLPSDLEDLKGYTSLSLFLQRPDSRENGGTEDMFVMYLGNKNASGDYIGMAVVDGQLSCVYSLGNRVAELQVDQILTESETQDALMDRVKFQRRKEESDKNYFEGTGYARVPTQANAFFPTFGQTIQTTMDRGLLFFAENQDHFISLNIEDGSVMVRYKLDSEAPREKGIRGTINNGKDHLILIKIGKMQNLMRINVDDQNIRIEGKIFDLSTYYLGGIPIAIRERFNISTPAFRGCMKNLKKTSGVVRLNDTVGVTKKCSEDWQLVRSASFSRGGQLSFSNLHVPPPGHFQASFGFQTFQPSGVLLHHQTRTSSLQVTLEDGHIELSTKESNSPIFTSPQTYMDGLLHYVSVISDTSGLRLLIDDQPLRSDQKLQGVSNSPQSLRLGGSAFEGCISNVFFQRFMESPEVLDFTNKSTKRAVSLGGCSLNKPPFLMLLKGSTRFNKARTFNINEMLQDAPAASPSSMEVWRDSELCSPPVGAQISHRALQFGDSPTSHLLFQLPQELLKPRSEFAVDIHTTSSGGLVFYTGAKNSFMALYLLKGHLVFALGAEGKKLRLKSKEKYNDGKWHTVVFGQDGRRGHLHIDGLKAREGSLPGNSTSSPRAQVYLGWSPSGKPKVTASVDSEAGRILTSVTPKQSLCDGQWHSVAVTIKQHILHLELDKDNSYTAGELTFPSHSTQVSLHIGGVPANLKTLNLPVWGSFFGCLKNVQVNHKPVPISEAMEIQGSVRLNGCPEY